MTLSQIAELAAEHPVGALLVGIALGTVAVKKLELPVWGWFLDWCRAKADAIGKALTASVMAEIGKLTSEVESLKAGQTAQKERAELNDAERHREHILRFNVELINDMFHDRESYVEVLDHIDKYAAYCIAHPEYPNSRADAAIQNIREHYQAEIRKGLKGFTKITIIKEVNA